NGIKGVLVLEPAPSDLATSGTGMLTINTPADEAKLGELIKTDPTVTVQLNIPDELSALEPLLPTFAGIKIPKESW
ncbi:MAG TPA: hypothetical protein VG742_08610, partial [Dongiaceae bacterium]|nr:hypothetical protein [Dongiaceae bacterium]